MKINDVDFDVVSQETPAEMRQRGLECLGFLMEKWGIVRCFDVTRPGWDGRTMPAFESDNNAIRRFELAADFFVRRSDLRASTIYETFLSASKGH